MSASCPAARISPSPPTSRTATGSRYSPELWSASWAAATCSSTPRGVTRFVPHADLDALDDELIDGILRTNVRGAIAAVRALRPLLERSRCQGGGVVVNVSSIAAVTGQGSNVAYCASKAALDSVTRSLGRALAPTIRVVSVSPGVVDTGFIRSLDPAWREEQLARTPLGRFASPEEVAAAILAVVRDLTFTTGGVVPVDGGRPLS